MDSGPLVQANNPNVREIQPAPGLDLGRPAGPPIYPQLPTHESPVSEYWRVLVNHKWTILGCLATIFSVVAIASLRLPKIYEASGTIAINKPDTSLSLQNSGAFSLDYYDPSELETEVKKLQTDRLALEVIRTLSLDQRPEFGGQASTSPSSDLAPDPLQIDSARASSVLGGFKGNLRVSLSLNTRIIEVHYRSTEPDTAANVVNSLMKNYIDDNRNDRFNSTLEAANQLQDKLVEMRMNVESSQEALVKYQREHEILGIDEKQNITTAKLDELNKALTSAESERMDKESFYRLVESGDPDAIAASAGGGDSGSQSASALLETLLAKQADLKIQTADLNTQFGPSYPKLAQLNNQLKEVDSQISAEMRKMASKVRGEYVTALGRENMLHDALEKQKQEANKLNESAIEYNMLKRDADTYRALYEGILEKLKEASVAAGLKSNNIQIVDAARTPSYPVEPNIPRNLGFALVLGLATGVGLAFLLEGLDNTIRSPEQAHIISGLPSLGMIPLGTKSAREGPSAKGLVIASSKEVVELVTQVRPQSAMSEAYRALRTSLLLSNPGAPPKVIMVTSALPQEGKTTTSINCAIVLAQKGASVLLIDADLRRPSIHKKLGLGLRSGLSDVLTGNATLEAIVPTAIDPNLSVLPAGTTPPYPAELLASSNMLDILAQLRGMYDHIVIDTPPALSVTDAVGLSPRADAVVLVIRSETTKKQALRRARDLLAQVGAKVVGVLLNAADLSSPNYHYYYEYQGKYAQYYREGDASGDESDDDVDETPAPSSSSA